MINSHKPCFFNVLLAVLENILYYCVKFSPKVKTMLIRFTIENIFSFDGQKEFNMLPYSRLQTLLHHKYQLLDFEVLKMASLYGANGAGKSNLIKALNLFQQFVVNEEIPFELKDTHFKLRPDNKTKSQVFAVEFIQDNQAFYYAIELFNKTIRTEELYLSGLGKTNDQLVFERHTSTDGTTRINFRQEFEKDKKNQLLKSILLEEFVKPDKPVLKLLSNRDNKHLTDTKTAIKWFEETLQIITPDSKPRALAHTIDMDTHFKSYAENMMRSFNIGIASLVSDKKSIHDFFGEDSEKELNQLIKQIENAPNNIIGLRSRKGDEIIVVKEQNNFWVKQLKIGHTRDDHSSALFDLDEESDGTIRLLDFTPAFREAIMNHKVFFIDEIERSIHPLLIKELVKKFSLDNQTKGQLIFTTHESNLLDQRIFRQDEIWFAEKDNNGATDLYALSDFKEHKTIDIRKGYLNGRYGSVPFLANLKDLNWH